MSIAHPLQPRTMTHHDEHIYVDAYLLDRNPLQLIKALRLPSSMTDHPASCAKDPAGIPTYLWSSIKAWEDKHPYERFKTEMIRDDATKVVLDENTDYILLNMDEASEVDKIAVKPGFLLIKQQKVGFGAVEKDETYIFRYNDDRPFGVYNSQFAIGRLIKKRNRRDHFFFYRSSTRHSTGIALRSNEISIVGKVRAFIPLQGSVEHYPKKSKSSD